MHVRITGRHDPLLFAGLTIALLVVFERSIQRLLDVARDVEATYDVALMPALLILIVMFVFHQYAKRREIKAEATAAAIEAAAARQRAEELERLMAFGHALARALSMDTLRETLWRHLGGVAGGDDAWVVLRSGTGWERLTDTACSRWPVDSIEGIAERATAAWALKSDAPDGVSCEGHVCFVMEVGGRPVGVLASARLRPGVPHALGAAAALLTIAVRNAQMFADVRDNSVKDGLTGCFNRGHGFEILDGELARSRRAATPLSVILFDIDHFKQINDRHGHLSGDSVLAAVAQRMKHVLRKSDIRCRYGGDEFLVVLPETSEMGAARVAEWLRAECEGLDLRPAGERLPITISAGVASAVGGGLTPAALIDRADQALYRAKAAGRNCVRILETATLPPVEFSTGVSLATH